MENPELLLQQISKTGEDSESDDNENYEMDKQDGQKFRDSIYLFREEPPELSWYDPSLQAFASLLHIAALFGFQPAVEALLTAGFDIDAVSSQTITATPLLCALYRGHIDIAKFFIENGANLHPAFLWSTAERPGFAPLSLLHYLVYIDEPSEATNLARLLTKNGADVHYKCLLKNLPHWDFLEAWDPGDSFTPLRWAVIRERPRLVRTLLALGAKFARQTLFVPSITNDDGRFEESGGEFIARNPMYESGNFGNVFCSS